LTGKSVESKIRMHKKKEGRGKYFLSLFFLDDFSNLMGTFGTNVNDLWSALAPANARKRSFLKILYKSERVLSSRKGRQVI
ncbi:MAG: hypothetical protein K9N06_11555, partial [Candidatus Cloacimonetes bacterium]|nr:hypothetical protein [Candidatus Cloacimonadota bacterium]